jgi:alanine racemase
MPDELGELASRIRGLSSLKVISVFSHLAASEDPSFDEFTLRQIERFTAASDIIREATGYPFLRHILNTSGIIRFPQYQFDMVRPGIGIYGVGSWKGINLRPVSRFKTKILQVKKVPAGEPVGYGCRDISDRERMIAILPVGYADGLRRILGNGKGSLLVKGRRVPLVGNICMDMCMVDVSAAGVVEGDDAEIFGPNMPISEIAGLCETIPYEILTSIPARVKRVFYRE